MPVNWGCVSFLSCALVQLLQKKKKALLEKCKMSQMSAQMIPFHCKIHGSWFSSQLYAYPVKLQTVLVSSVQSVSASAEKEEREWLKSGSAGSSPSCSTSSASWPIEVGQVPPLQSQGCHFFQWKNRSPTPISVGLEIKMPLKSRDVLLQSLESTLWQWWWHEVSLSSVTPQVSLHQKLLAYRSENNLHSRSGPT